MKLQLTVTRTEHPKAKPEDESKLGFGRLFTDHMFLMDYTEGQGWHDARIVPYGPLSLDPSAMVFHYAQELFEGMKAYRNPDGAIRLFRPECNIERMNNTCDRLCVPRLDPEQVMEAIEAVVDTDRDWVPHASGTSLYIRPFIIATDPYLGVHRPSAPTMRAGWIRSKSSWSMSMSAASRAAPVWPRRAAIMRLR